MNLSFVGVDDANILFVYSKHLAAGNGLVYNIGEERVEGFSSMSWMLISAIGYWLSSQPEKLFFVVNIVLVGCALGYAWHFVSEHESRSTDLTASTKYNILTATSLIWIVWVIANPSYFIWTVTSLMETGLWAALLLITSIQLLKFIDSGFLSRQNLAIFATLNALLILTRPEAMAWMLYFMAMLLLILRWQQLPITKILRAWVPVASLSVICLGLLVLFRLEYFGYPLPNTYYAKMTPDKLYDLRFGLIYLTQFFRMNYLAIATLAVAAFVVIFYLPHVCRIFFFNQAALKRNQLTLFIASATALVGVVLPVLMGGDIFGGFRFFQPIWPLLILPLLLLETTQNFLRNSFSVSGLRISAIVLASLAVFTTAHTIRWPSLSADKGRIAHLYELTERGILTGQYIQDIFSKNSKTTLPSLGASAAGGYKMGYPGIVIDTMGLNFTPMAHHGGDKKGERGHASFNKSVFWQYATDLVEPTLCPQSRPLENQTNDPDHWLYKIYQQLFSDAEFKQRYKYVGIKSPLSNAWVCTYIQVGLLESLRQQESIELIQID